MGAVLIPILIGKIPELVALAQGWFREANPNLPVPTSEEVVAAWLQAATSSILKDDLWLQSHPRT